MTYDHTDALRSPMLVRTTPADLAAAVAEVYCVPGPDGWQPRGVLRALEVARELDRG